MRNGTSLRRGVDGSYILIRHNNNLEHVMDRDYIRVPGELKWYPKNKGLNLEPYKNLYEGYDAFIIGKGPSLDTLDHAVISKVNTVVYCLNQAIHVIERLNPTVPVFCVQQDVQLKNKCVPLSSTHLLSTHASCWNPNAVIYDPKNFNANASTLTAIMAIHLANYMGCKRFKLLAFDSFKGETKYAESLTLGGQKNDRFKNHKKKILSMLIQVIDQEDFYILANMKGHSVMNH